MLAPYEIPTLSQHFEIPYKPLASVQKPSLSGYIMANV